MTKSLPDWLDGAARWPGVAWRDLRRAVRRFRHVSVTGLAANALRTFRLHRRAGPALPIPARPERIVVTLTTIPGRIARIAPALRSLLDQSCPADRIILALPSHSRRTGAPYPAAPPLPDGVDILPCDDEGPATKLLPALRAEPDALIIVADDDVVYPRNFIANLLAAHRADPSAAFGWRGWRLEPGVDPRDFAHVFATAVREPTPVDVLLGTWGYLIPPGAFDAAVFDFDSYPPEARWVDDVWVSGHLARRGVPRLVVPSPVFPIETPASFVAALTDTVNRSGHNDAVAIEAFSAWWRK